MKGKTEMYSERKLTEYRSLRNEICKRISIAEEEYSKVNFLLDYNSSRKDCLETIAFYKDILAIMSKNKEMICNDN